MSNEPKIESLISDLKKIRQTCSRKQIDEIPDVATRYLFVNRHLIRYYLNQLYTRIDRTQRDKLYEEHHGSLDYSAISDEWYPIAESATNDAERQHEHPDSADFFKISDDDINCLLRGLEYAKYFPIGVPEERVWIKTLW
jgi:hypothetical protein